MEPTARPSTARPEEFDEFDTLGRYDDPDTPTSEERTMGLLAHLAAFAGLVVPFGNIAGPLVLYLVKREESEFIADQAREALNFNLTMTLAGIVAGILILVLIGILLLPLVGLAWLVLTIVAAIKANEGEWYRYPINIRFVK